MAIRTLKGLLCDLDGTLVDSEPLHCTAWLATLADHGLDYDADWFEQYVGTSDRVLAREVVTAEGLSISEVDLIGQKQARYHRAVAQEGKSFADIDTALQAVVESGYPLAIATNSGREDADVMIDAARLDRYTAISVTASDVEKMKPAPDIYLLAASKLGLEAHECIAIEDSGPGGLAAGAAGCYLIGLTAKVTNADERIDDQAAAVRRALDILRAGSVQTA